jgi:hypothetical protein
MIKRFLGVPVAASLLLGMASFARADISATLTFTDSLGNPDTGGIVAPTASIPVWLTLTLGTGSDPLTTDGVSTVTSPTLDFSTMNPYSSPPQAPDLSHDIIYATVNEAAGCSGTFINSDCSSGAYGFAFNFGPPPAGTPPAFVTPQNFSLTAGNSYTWELGTFTPTGGSAPAGTYTFPYASVAFYVYDGSILVRSNPDGTQTVCGSDTTNCYSEAIGGIPLADTSSEAAFTRTVVAAPEPSSLIFLSAMLLGLAFVARKRIAEGL